MLTLARSIGHAGAAVVSVTGDAGIGKTAFLDAIKVGLGSLDVSVLHTGLSEAERPLTWAGLRHLLRWVGPDRIEGLPGALQTALRGALGEAVATAVDPGLVSAGLAGLLSAEASQGPVAVLVDDLHWLDAATASALAYAVRATSGAPLLTVFAQRPRLDLPLVPERLLDDNRTAEVVLHGLSVAGTHQLLERSCGFVVRRPDLTRLHAMTGGNPLYVLETGRLLAAGVSMHDALVPPSLEATIRQRLGVLPPDARHSLEAVAVASAPTVDLVARTLPGIDVEGALLLAEEAAVIEVTGDDIEFTHPLLRAAMLRGLPELRRRRLTLRLAEEVADPDERALLLADVTRGCDETVAGLVERAGERAAEQGAPLLASERFRRAADLTGDVAGRARRLVLAAEYAFQGGDLTGTLAAADTAHAAAHDVELRVRAGLSAVLAVAHLEPLQHALRRAETLLDDADGHPAEQVRVLRTIARIHSFDNLDAARDAIDRAIALVSLTGDEEAVALVVVTQALITQLRGDPVDVDRIAALSRQSLSSAALPTRSLLLELLTWTDRVDEAIALGWVHLAEAEQRGSIDDMNAVRDQLADACFRAGRWAEAAALVRQSLEADRLTPTTGPADCRPADLAQTLAAMGHDAEARALLEPVLRRDDLATTIALQRDARAGFVFLAAGAWTEAASHLRDARRHAAAMHQGDLGCIPFRADLVEALVHLGDIDEAAEVADELAHLAERGRLPRGLVEQARARGLVLGARGERAAAIGALEDALAAHAAWPLPFERGRTLLALGAALRRAGQRARAASCLDDAAAVFRQLGARRWVDRVTAERDRLGIRRTDGAQLTVSERRVADLAAGGRTNTEIAAELMVSLRTVESNLTRVYRKLGVRSRTELAARVRP